MARPPDKKPARRSSGRKSPSQHSPRNRGPTEKKSSRDPWTDDSPFAPATEVSATRPLAKTEVAPRPQKKVDVVPTLIGNEPTDPLTDPQTTSVHDKKTAIKPNPLDLESTELDAVPVPRQTGSKRAPLTEVMGLIGDKRPDLVDFVLNLEKDARIKAEGSVRADLKAQDERLADLADRVRALVEAEQKHGDSLSKLVNATEHEQRDTLSEAKAVNKNYKTLMDKIVEERDRLAKQLDDMRTQHGADAKEQVIAFSKLREQAERERRIADDRVNAAEAKSTELRERVLELEDQVREALDSRDRIATRVQKIEARLDTEVLPLRTGIEELREREGNLLNDLEKARKEIGTLKLLHKPPR